MEFLENSNNETVPKLIPVYAHRYVPCYPDIMDIPVISVYQTDIVFYGKNLEDYFKSEFGMKNCIDDFLKNYLKKKSNSKEDKNEEKIERNEDMSNNNKDDNIQNKEKEDNFEKEESKGCQNIADLHYKYIPFWEDIINCRFVDED